MPHPVGERLRCDECGAEIMFVQACSCPVREPKQHADICCGKEMHRVDVEASTEAEQVEAAH